MVRVVSWFSCGIPSAVATKLALSTKKLPFGATEIVIANCQVKEEHLDNERFLVDCEKWFGQKVVRLCNKKYNGSTHEVYRKTKYLVGPKGARCTGELKKSLRWEFGRPDDVVILGYTREEQHRIARITKSEPWTRFWPILIDHNLYRHDVMAIFAKTKIKRPVMYDLGYKNNNCIGCVKGGLGYWNKIRIDFPERFEEMSKIERELGRTICKLSTTVDGESVTKRIYLDQLPKDVGVYNEDPEPECGFFCHRVVDMTKAKKKSKNTKVAKP